MLDGVALVDNVDTALDNNTVKNVPCIIGILSEDMWPYTLYDAAVEYGEKRAQAGGEPVYLSYFDRQQPAKISLGHFTPQTCIMCSVHSTGTGGPLTTQITVLRRT